MFIIHLSCILFYTRARNNRAKKTIDLLFYPLKNYPRLARIGEKIHAQIAGLCKSSLNYLYGNSRGKKVNCA